MEALNKESEFATLHVMFQCPSITLHKFLSGDENADQLRLDQETVSALLRSMDTEYDRSILRAIITLLHTRSDPNLATRKIKEVFEVAEEKLFLRKNEKPGQYRVQLFKYVCKNATQVFKQQFLKAYPSPLICILKKHPPFSLILKILPPPHSKHLPPLGINNEQSLTA